MFMVCQSHTRALADKIGLVTGQIASEIQILSRCIEQLYGTLNEDSLKLQ
jgi:hypothetical protein